MLKIRRPLGRLIFNMGIAIPGKTVFLIETAPSFWYNTPHGWYCKCLEQSYFVSFHLSVPRSRQYLPCKYNFSRGPEYERYVIRTARFFKHWIIIINAYVCSGLHVANVKLASFLDSVFNTISQVAYWQLGNILYTVLCRYNAFKYNVILCTTL